MNDETLAALERAAAGCDKTVALLDLMLSRRPGSTFDASDAATRDQAKSDAALIRALIERERGVKPPIVRIDPAQYEDGLYLNPITGAVMWIAAFPPGASK